MRKKLEKALNLSSAEAEGLERKIKEHINFNHDNTISKEEKLNLALQDIGFSKKEINRFLNGYRLYSPPKKVKKSKNKKKSNFAANPYNTKKGKSIYLRGAPPLQGGAPGSGKKR